MRIFITGGAGFIPSNLATRLVREGHEVTCYDNLSLGRRDFLLEAEATGRCRFVEADLLDMERLKVELAGHERVFHLAANSDISHGAAHTDWDLRQGTIATWNVLEAMRLLEIRDLVFSSTSAIYGESSVLPTPENYGPLFPISLYGASKLACEGLVTAFCHNFGLRARIYRFANIVGRNGTHGALVDFIRRLRQDSSCLRVLGDGRQAKPYIHVADCVDAMLYGVEHGEAEVECWNLSCDGATSVSTIARTVLEEMGLPGARLEYTGGSQGWKGDVAQVRLDPARIRALGWSPRFDSDGAVRQAVRDLLSQDHL